MDERCLYDREDFIIQEIAIVKNLRFRLENASTQQQFLETIPEVEEETRNISTTPTSDFIDDLPQHLPGTNYYIDD